MTKRQRFIIRWLVLTLLAVFVLTPLPGLRSEKQDYREQLRRGDFISRGEMLQFLETWSDFTAKNIFQSPDIQASLSMEKPSESFPPKIARWLRHKGWHADRFFYVEQRLKSIVKSAQLQQQVLENRKLLASTKPNFSNSAYNALQNLINEQDAQLNLYHVTQGEIDMVMPQLPLISDILEGRAVYRPASFF